MCVQNAGRIQTAAALIAHHGQGRVHVRSAGSQPAVELETEVVAVQSELGLDLSTAFPKPLTDDVVRAADVVITMGCGDACPVFPGKKYLDGALEDPAGQGVDAAVRLIRDEIETRIRVPISEIAPAGPA
ncbi:phosphotyrosine protein phosphatase [Streptomyces sp. NPDC005811]|uniref:arsenate reductase/protein-tyrosine-phosphatase family protein n=1 Tax=Streptomyces sp. NPDC005811 TaxID=3154565 RepID=UPI0033FEC06E